MDHLEPLGFLRGSAAAAAISAGWALPFGPPSTAFTSARPVGQSGVVLPVSAAPESWRPALSRLSALPPDAGLPPGLLVMGILNLTPDSFSDGGRFPDPGAAVEAGSRMAADGADLLDVGGESTRPDAVPVSPDEERARILPVVRALAAAGLRVSVDSRNASTLAAALDAGAVLANDVSALRHDPETARVLAARDAPVCLMHSRGDPRTMNDRARYRDVVAEILSELSSRIDVALAAGLGRDQVLVDPGIGFAKTAEQNVEVLHRLPALASLGCRILLGVSRKRFIGSIGNEPDPLRRLPGSLAALGPALDLPNPILRVHDVRETVQALRIRHAIMGTPLPS